MIARILTLVLILIPFGNILRIPVGAGVSVLALDVVVGVCALLMLPNVVQKTYSGLRKMLWYERMALVFLLSAGLSLFISSFNFGPAQIRVALLYFIRFAAYVVLLLGLRLQDRNVKKDLHAMLVISGLGVILIGFLQYFLYPDLRNLFYAGWDEHLYRMFGSFLDPNFLGASIVMTIGLLWDSKIHETWRFAGKWLLGLMAVAVVALFLTYSRSSMLMFVVAGITYALLQKKAALVGGVIGVMIVGVLLLPKGLGGEGVNLLRTASISARATEFTQALEIAREAPIFGVGFNTYRYAQLRRGYIDLESWQRDHAGAGVPNSYLFVLATTGVVGLAAFIGFLGALLRHVMQKKRYVLVSVLVGLLVHAMFENTLFYPFVLVPLFMWFGGVMRS